MTGAPAETWQRFRFVTAPAWAYAFLILVCTGIGLLPIFILMAVVSRRASGHLPLTRMSQRRVRRATWICVDLLVLAVLLWVGAAFVASIWSGNSTASTIAGISVFLGFLSILAAIIGWLLVRPRFGPGGQVLKRPTGYQDYLVELRRVHPAFVAAVNQAHQARAAQYAAMQAPAGLQAPPHAPAGG
jgi:hypothetical protein